MVFPILGTCNTYNAAVGKIQMIGNVFKFSSMIIKVYSIGREEKE